MRFRYIMVGETRERRASRLSENYLDAALNIKNIPLIVQDFHGVKFNVGFSFDTCQ